MKNYTNILFLFIGLFTLTACPPSKNGDARKILKKNHYNFSNFKDFYYKGLAFNLPNYFVKEYGRSHLIKDDAFSMFNPETSIYFSIERFEEHEVKDIKFAYVEGTESLDALSSYYTDMRANSIDIAKVSLKEDFKTKQKSGYFQYVSGSDTYQEENSSMYMLASFQKSIKGKNYYYVLQLVAPIDLAKYLVDDFKNLTYSTR